MMPLTTKNDANMKYWMWVAVIIWSRCSCSIATMGEAAEAAAAVSYWQKRLPGAGMPTSLRAMVSPLSSHEASQLLINIQQQAGSRYYLPTHAEQFCKAARIQCPHHHQRSSLAHSSGTLGKLELPRFDSSAPPNHLPLLNKPVCEPVNLPFFLHYEHEKLEGCEGSQYLAGVPFPPHKLKPTSDPQKLVGFNYEHEKDGLEGLQKHYEHEKEGLEGSQYLAGVPFPPRKLKPTSDPQKLLAGVPFPPHKLKPTSDPQKLLAGVPFPPHKLKPTSDPQKLLGFNYEDEKDGFEGLQSSVPQYYKHYEHEKEGLEGSQYLAGVLFPPHKLKPTSDPQKLLAGVPFPPHKLKPTSDPQKLLLGFDHYEQEKDQGSEGSQYLVGVPFPPHKLKPTSDPQKLLGFNYEDEKDGFEGLQSSVPHYKHYEHEKEGLEGSKYLAGVPFPPRKLKPTSDPQKLSAGVPFPPHKLKPTSDPQKLSGFNNYEHEKEGSEGSQYLAPGVPFPPHKLKPTSDPQPQKLLAGVPFPPHKLKPTSDPQKLLGFNYEHEKDGFEGSQSSVPHYKHYEHEKKGSEGSQYLAGVPFPPHKLKPTSDPQKLLAGVPFPPHKLKPTSDPQKLSGFNYEHEKDGFEGSQSASVPHYKLIKQDGPQRHEISSRIFFREQQVLVRGADIHVNFAYGVDDTAELERAFLPRKLAKLFPLAAGAGGAEIASKLALSLQDEDLQGTMELCFANIDMHTDVDVRRCLSSMEDVADFVRSVMRDQSINIYDAIANAGTAELMKAGKTFHVVDVRMLKADRDEPAVACHDMPFPFRVFYCHYVKQTMIFQATLRSGEDGSIHERIAVCHYNTSYWTPRHTSFSELNTKPGESEACYWLGGAWFHRKGWVFVRGAIAAIA